MYAIRSYYGLAASILARRYSAYLFDLDGTLIDSAPDINRALNHALAAAHLPAVDEALSYNFV